VLGDLGTDVRRIGRFACGLWVDALEPGPVGVGGVPLVAVGGDAADVPLGIDHGPQSTADGDEAESVRVRFRERVSGPCGEDGEVEPAGHPPGGGGCAALFLLGIWRRRRWGSETVSGAVCPRRRFVLNPLDNALTEKGARLFVV
jgi:MYXO-CTERM domain-containing protein